MPNLSFLSHLVRPRDSFITNKGYIVKKSLKIAKSRSNHQKSHLINIKWLDLYQRVPNIKNRLPRATTVANMYFFAVIKDYAPKPEVDFEISRKCCRAQIMIIQRSHIPNFKSLCHLVRSTDSFEIKKGYITKNSQKI